MVVRLLKLILGEDSMEELALFLFYILSLVVISILVFGAGRDTERRQIGEEYQECIAQFSNHEKCYSLVMKEEK